jgi:hypothetical protein
MANVDEMAFHRRGYCHCRRHEMSPAAGPLASFEVSIAGRSAALSGLKHVGIHRQAHTAAGFPPLESRLFEQSVEPFLFGLLFHETRTRDDHRMNGLRDMLALRQARCQAKILDA